VKAIWKRLTEEPALLAALLEVAVAGVGAWGLDLTVEQLSWLYMLIAVLTGVGVRQSVVPMTKMDEFGQLRRER
jgi:hypothetical protein